MFVDHIGSYTGIFGIYISCYLTFNITGSVALMDLGFHDWGTLESWLKNKTVPQAAISDSRKELKLKFPDIPVLSDYSMDPGDDFWKIFPSKTLPDKPQTKIDIVELEKMVIDVSQKGLFSPTQLARASTVIDNLKKGAPSNQQGDLPGCFVANAKSTLQYGREVTDAVAYWVENGFVAGPFQQPPLLRFRVNPIVAVVQDDKVRLVLNVSSPNGNSFNSNINKLGLEKVRMSSARSFG